MTRGGDGGKHSGEALGRNEGGGGGRGRGEGGKGESRRQLVRRRALGWTTPSQQKGRGEERKWRDVRGRCGTSTVGGAVRRRRGYAPSTACPTGGRQTKGVPSQPVTPPDAGGRVGPRTRGATPQSSRSGDGRGRARTAGGRGGGCGRPAGCAQRPRWWLRQSPTRPPTHPPTHPHPNPSPPPRGATQPAVGGRARGQAARDPRSHRRGADRGGGSSAGRTRRQGRVPAGSRRGFEARQRRGAPPNRGRVAEAAGRGGWVGWRGAERGGAGGGWAG